MKTQKSVKPKMTLGERLAKATEKWMAILSTLKKQKSEKIVKNWEESNVNKVIVKQESDPSTLGMPTNWAPDTVAWELNK